MELLKKICVITFCFFGHQHVNAVPCNKNFNCTEVCTPNANLVSKTQFESFLSTTFTGSRASYNTLVPPRADLSVVQVNMSFDLLQVIDFNEVAGTLEIVGFLTLLWNDELVDDSFDEVDHGSLTKFLIPENYVWKPPVSVFNSVKAIIPIADSTYHVRVQMGYTTCVKNDSNEGTITKTIIKEVPLVTWKPGINSKSACLIDVTHFPFDSQECVVRFISFGHPSTEVKFNALEPEVNLTDYQDNMEWTLDSTAIEVEEIDGSSFILVKLKFTRRPLYFVVNLVTPILILAVISTLVFLLPGNSGERIGYSVTAFLTFAVYLTMISDNLPKTSDPMSTLCYFLMCMVAISAGTAFVTIFTLRIFHKDEKKMVPNWLSNLIGCLNCRICSEDEFEDPEYPVNFELQKRGKLDTRSIVTTDSDEEHNRKWGVDWKLVASTLDMLFFLVFIGLNAIVCVVFLVPLLEQMNT
ncbi:Hypothetical predicted protein [Mytilus galloprovincialis]|uniref:Uncharacterized protein n=1 Tax=Mytilus galloprovincialis TaxID=29158 RepID=A0A8B6C2Q6_MYTGA|nr:Hypothetical predicted protein [Mytilus galloprovincialis]